MTKGELAKARAISLKRQILKLKGDKCERCGYAYPKALGLFPQEDRTPKIRLNANTLSWVSLSKINEQLNDYRVLCFNCNAETLP